MQDRPTSDPLIEVLVCRHDSNPSSRISDKLSPANSRPIVDMPEPNREDITVHPDPPKMDAMHRDPTEYLMDTWYGLETLKGERS
jgi:hypothetical protein